VFGQPAGTIALLWIVSSILGIVFKPMVGRMIDRWGERRVLILEGLSLILVCLGYAYGDRAAFGVPGLGLGLVYACYVGDQLLFAAGMARTTYLCKIARDQRDITPTLSLGISIDHAVSIGVAGLGGLAWMRWGYQGVFLGAAVIAGLNLAAAARIHPGGRPGCPAAGTAASGV
ncbi:MAG: MFS transporter, partial [Bacteroidota bacterium]